MSSAVNNERVQKKRPYKRRTTSDFCENLSTNGQNKIKIPKFDNTSLISKQSVAKNKRGRKRKQPSCEKGSKVIVNGETPPSLAELDKLYEDSDSDLDIPKTSIMAPQNTLEENASHLVLSPNTIKLISERMLDLLSQTHSIQLLNDDPLPPVIPPKKKGKSDVPYIVGCKERPQVENRPSTSFCKGDDYGIKSSGQITNEDEDLPPNKRTKKSKIPKYSKSIFNAHSDDIAVALQTSNDTAEVMPTNDDAVKRQVSNDITEILTDDDDTVEMLINNDTAETLTKVAAEWLTTNDATKRVINDAAKDLTEDVAIENQFIDDSAKMLTNNLANQLTNDVGRLTEDSVETVTINDAADSLKTNDDFERDTKDDAAERVTEDNATKRLTNNAAVMLHTEDDGNLSDGSSDSNKTIEYNSTLQRHFFSPLPSTSTDNKIFIENDKLFNESLKENNISKDSTPNKKEHDKATISKACIVDTPIGITDIQENKLVETENTNIAPHHVNEGPIIEPLQHQEVTEVVDGEENDKDDCILISCSSESNNEINLNQPIVIDDEYANITIDSSDGEIEIIDVDEVINENKSIIDKWKNNAVVDVPSTYVNSLTLQPTTSATKQANTCTTPESIMSTTVQPTTSTISHPNPSTISQQSTNTASQPTITSGIVRTDEFNSHPPNNRATHTEISNSDERSFINTLSPNQRSNNTLLEKIANFLKSKPNLLLPNKDSTLLSRDQNSSFNVPNSRKEYGDLITYCIKSLTASQNVHANGRTAATMHANTETTSASTNIPNHLINNTIRNPNFYAGRLPNPSGQQESENSQSSTEASGNVGNCPICLDPRPLHGMAATVCGHVFCLKCIQAAIRVNGKRCPTCRKVLKGNNGFHQIFF